MITELKPGTEVTFNCEPKIKGVIISHDEMSKYKEVCPLGICIEWETDERSTYDIHLFNDGTISVV